MDKLRKNIQTNLRRCLYESFYNTNVVDFNSFPKNILKTLFDEYGDFAHNFDWNEKSDEFDSPEEFNKWLQKNKRVQFLKNVDSLIKKTSQDIQLLKKKRIVKAKLEAFEELIIPTLGDEVLSPALSKFEEDVLMNPNASLKDIEQGFEQAKDILDDDGNLNQSKIKQSEIFTGGGINLPNFERFVQKNPEYKGVFNDWKKLFDEDTQLSITDLNAFRNSTPLERIVELRDFLVDFKNKMNN